MMWGSLWDSVREAELDPKEYVELVIKNLSVQSASFSSYSSAGKGQAKDCTLNCGETDEGTIQTLLGRVATAMHYYISAPTVAGGLMLKPDREEGRNTQRSAYALANARASAPNGDPMLKPDREEGRNTQRSALANEAVSKLF